MAQRVIESGVVPASGEVLAGKYRVDRELGRGAMGIVVAATHLELRQPVAIKLLLPRLMDTPMFVERFLREARATVQLHSEHVARALDVGRTSSGVPFIVMEYLEGADLSEVLQAQGALPVRRAADYILQACEAIAEAHARGIIHRDLKPQNLFVTRRVGGEPLLKVLDFGISRSAESGLSPLTQLTGFVGSPVYTAPEQLRASKDVDGRSDIWSLGVVLQELTTKRLPFEGETVPELTLHINDEAPRSPLLDRPDLPPGFVRIIERCLQKEPAKRFANVADLALALEAFASPTSLGLAARASATLGRVQLAGAATQGEPMHDGMPDGQTTRPVSAARIIARPAVDPTRPRSWRWALLVLATAFAGAAIVLVRHRTSGSGAPAPAESTAAAPPPGASGPPAASSAPAITPEVTTASASARPPTPRPVFRPRLVKKPPPNPDDEIPSMR